jgi:hypothetical protein
MKERNNGREKYSDRGNYERGRGMCMCIWGKERDIGDEREER